MPLHRSVRLCPFFNFQTHRHKMDTYQNIICYFYYNPSTERVHDLELKDKPLSLMSESLNHFYISSSYLFQIGKPKLAVLFAFSPNSEQWQWVPFNQSGAQCGNMTQSLSVCLKWTTTTTMVYDLVKVQPDLWTECCSKLIIKKKP